MSLGYCPHLEDHKELRDESAPFAVCAVANAPEEIDHRAWAKVENQGAMNSCVGNGTSSVLEVCNFIATGGQVVQLSRIFCYLTSQQYAVPPIRSDSGSYIAAAAKASKELGICLEKTFPYPARYTRTIPQAATAEAKDHKLRRHTVMNDYESCFAWLATGQGGISIGVRWVPSLSQTRGVVEALFGSSNGFHCVALLGYSKRKDSRDRNYLWLVNSHGTTWGNAGWAEIAPSVVDQWCRRRDSEELVGFSDLEAFGPREIPSWRGAFSRERT